ncbi:MAG TPA: flagellar hook-length control protein FliK [Pseudobacteroides sp.]|uniref:flagellar hook-length control protein FliK n=1 Tax=Pseudobacteroides sp. TaxID=1968840 RepID=UPI002F91F597
MRVTHFNNIQAASVTNIDEILSKLNVGDSLKARVMGISENELILKLSDGSLIKAASMIPLDLEQGQLVDFIVKNKTDNQLFIETIKTNVQKSDSENIKAALLSMDIKPDEKNMEIANAIKSNNISINKDVFKNIFDSLKFFKNLSPLKAAFLAANNFSIGEKNISALNSLSDSSTKMGKSLDSLQGLLESMGDPELLEKIEANLSKNTGLNSNVHNKAQTNTGTNIPIDIKKLIENTKTSADSSLKNPLNMLTDGEIEGLSKLIQGSIEGDSEALLNKIKDYIKGSMSNLDLSNIANDDKIADGSASYQDGKKINGENKGIDIKFTQLEIDDFIRDMKSLFEKTKTNGTDSTGSQETKNLHGTGSSDRENKVISKIFNSLFVRIDSETLKDDLHAKNLYKDINNVLEIIRDTAAASDSPMKDQIIGKTENMQNMIRFMNELNSHSTFLQIPVKLIDQNTNCEIYVLKKNGGKNKIDPNNATAYISLDTTNIGKVDSLISLNKKNISVNMIVSSIDVRDFVKTSYSILYKSLREKGYNLVDLKCRVVEEDVNFINVNQVMNKDMAKRGTIDFKV